MKSLLLSFFLLILSCQAYPAHADEALKNGAAPAVTAARASNGNIPERMDKIDAVPVPAAAKAVIQPETNATRKDAAETDKQLAVAQAKIEAAQKYQAALEAQIASFKDKDDADTKLWIRILASACILACGVVAYLWGQSGSFIRAGSAAAVGLVLGLGLFVAAANWALVVWIVIGTVIAAALLALAALAAHLWKHGSANAQKVEALLETSAGTAAGAAGISDMTTKEYWATLYAEHGKKIADALWDAAAKRGIALPR